MFYGILRTKHTERMKFTSTLYRGLSATDSDRVYNTSIKAVSVVGFDLVVCHVLHMLSTFVTPCHRSGKLQIDG